VNLVEIIELISLLSSFEETTKFVNKCSNIIYDPDTSLRDTYQLLSKLAVIGNNMPIGCGWNDLWVEVFNLIRRV